MTEPKDIRRPEVIAWWESLTEAQREQVREKARQAYAKSPLMGPLLSSFAKLDAVWVEEPPK